MNPNKPLRGNTFLKCEAGAAGSPASQHPRHTTSGSPGAAALGPAPINARQRAAWVLAQPTWN